jgi:hypothetical protein
MKPFQCKFCRQRGTPSDSLSEPICGFTSDSHFNPNNLNCDLLNKLRCIKEPDFYNNDHNITVVPLPDHNRFMIISCYKRRGNTQAIWIVGEGSNTLITLSEAEQIYYSFQSQIDRRIKQIDTLSSLHKMVHNNTRSLHRHHITFS